jgi:hypothetical protein
MKKRRLTVDELFPRLAPSIENAGAEALESKLIDAFESALQQGVTPLEALSIILEWASSELHRFRMVREASPDSGGSVRVRR